MAWNYGFFNSVNGDRLYNADTMSRIFEGLIGNGVYESVGNKMAVQPNSGMVIQIATGRGWFANRWVNNDTEYTMTVEASDVVLNRYAAVVIKVDNNDAVRSAVPYLKYSEFATDPIKPTMERSEKINEYCLAYIYVGAGATEITAADIEDTRANNSLCGWVTGLIEQLSTTTLFTQWETLFNNWFANLQNVLDQNTAAMLVGALPTSVTVSLPVASWTQSGDIYTQTAQVTSMNTTKSVIIQAHEDTEEAFTNANIKCTAQANGTLTFTAESLPTETIKVKVLHMGV